MFIVYNDQTQTNRSMSKSQFQKISENCQIKLNIQSEDSYSESKLIMKEL